MYFLLSESFHPELWEMFFSFFAEVATEYVAWLTFSLENIKR